MKMTKRWIAFLLAILMIGICTMAQATEDGFHTSYTYNYDYWGDIRESPDAYSVQTVIYSGDLGLETAMKKPQSLFIRNEDIYVCDTGNNRILQIHRSGNDYTLTRIIDKVNGVEPADFDKPNDVYVDEAGNIYVADMNHNRVVMMDGDLNFVKVFTKPDDATFSQDSGFLPSKIVVDVAGRLYVLASNVNKGLIKYESDTTFTGYIGANKVTYNLAEYIWKMYFTTKEQRAQQESFVPTEYENIYMDSDGFIYATNTVFSEYDLKYDNAKPIRRLNGVGNDILIKNDRYPPIGELYWTEGSIDYGPSKLTDITVLENDIYVAFDRTRGRIFGYDAQGIMLWAFGTKGNTEGAFIMPVAIEHMGHDLFCLDASENSITVFTPTEYGELIYAANSDYLKGEYDTAADKWKQVLALNANYNLAFIGIGRSMLRQGEYSGAMEYFKMAHDRINYGRAFRYFRKDWVEKNILWIVIPLACLLILPLIAKQRRKMRFQVGMYEYHKSLIGQGGSAVLQAGGYEPAEKKKTSKPQTPRRVAWEKYKASLKYALHVIFRPFDGFWDLIHEGRGSMGAAITILVLFLITYVLKLMLTSFQFLTVSLQYINIFKQCASLLLPFLILCLANWSLTTLFDGKGRFKDIFMAMCYVLVPYVIIQLPLVFISNIIATDEAAFYSVLMDVSIVWMAFLAFVGLMQVHDYGPGKTIIFLIATVLGACIIIFLMLVFLSLLSDAVAFFVSLFRETAFRLY